MFMRNQILVFAFITLLCPLLAAQTPSSEKENKPPKLSAEEIVSKHLNSIGKKEDLASIKSIVLTGKGTITSKLGATFLLTGNAQMASTGKSFLMAMAFDSPVYPYEKLAFDGEEASYGLINGRPSILGTFLKSQTAILKEGLMGGVLSTGWPLLSLTGNSKIKLESAGTSRIGERQCYKLKYSSSKIGDLKVILYFDAETFRHIRTEYSYTIEPRIGTSPTDVRSSSRIERYTLTESFGNFTTAGKVVVPTIYNVNVTTERQIATEGVLRDWNFLVEQVYFDEPLKAELFRVS